jgi:hypothetical protein
MKEPKERNALQAQTNETEFNSEPSLTEFEIAANAQAEEEEIIQRLVLIFQELAMRGRELTAKDQNYNDGHKPERNGDETQAIDKPADVTILALSTEITEREK